ncbi:MAG: hypothetical protein ACYDDB_02185 [bacterium]
MKIKKIIMSALLLGIFGLGAGLLLSGCSGVNASLEKAHIMNNGCFITCYNKPENVGTASAKNAGKRIKNNARLKSRNIKHNDNAYSEKIDG